MATQDRVTVLATGFLHSLRRERGLPAYLTLAIPGSGTTARDLALELGLPVERIEGIFLNHSKAGLRAAVRPGDRVAFVPYGTPASHPAFFGPFAD